MTRPTLAALVSVLISTLPAQVLAAQRAYVASYGNDANVGVGCTLAATCRSFAAAHSAVDAGGEIVALDAAGYGAVTITKSVTITANPGYFAGIAASSGHAVTISTVGVNVTLRGLSLNGVGALSGILMTAGSRLTVENCVISGFTSDAILVSDIPRVRILNTTVRNNGLTAIRVQGTSGVDISNVQALDNNYPGLWTSGSSKVVVTDSVFSGNAWGIVVALGSVASLIRTTASHSEFHGVQTDGGLITIGHSQASANGTYGFYNTSGTFQSLGNNVLNGNGTAPTSGTITMIAGN